MKEVLLSDWTLVAFKQREREEERRRKERDEAARIPPNEEMQRNNETLRSDWTVAALQKRFTALEQRLAVLEQREEERRKKEQPEATRRLFAEEKQCSKEVFPRDSTTIGPEQRDEERSAKEQPEFAEAKIQHQQVEAIRHPNEQVVEREGAATVTVDERERLQGNRMDIHPARNGETVHIGAAHKMLRRFFSVMITASIAGAISFGIGVYVVPIEEASQFRALVKRGLDSTYGVIITSEKRLYQTLVPNKSGF